MVKCCEELLKVNFSLDLFLDFNFFFMVDLFDLLGVKIFVFNFIVEEVGEVMLWFDVLDFFIRLSWLWCDWFELVIVVDCFNFFGRFGSRCFFLFLVWFV